MSHYVGGFYHKIEYYTMLVYINTEISIIQYMFVKYYLRFVVLILSEDLVTYIIPTYNLHT